MNEKLQKDLSDLHGIELNSPLYVYQIPMFMLTVSTVLVVENGAILVEDNGIYRFPTTRVRAGQETIPFAAIRSVKEETDIVLKRDSLIPVDFRSSPERSKEGNVVDIGMVCTLDRDACPEKWHEVDFENRCFHDETIKLCMDHDILLERAIDIACMIRE
jgi:hypothetical protein